MSREEVVYPSLYDYASERRTINKRMIKMKSSMHLAANETVQESRPATGPVTRRDLMLLGVVILTTLAVRVGYFLAIRGEAYFITPIVDSFNYDQWAREIIGGDLIGKSFFIHSPLYAYLIAVVYAVFGASPVVMASFQLFVMAPTAAGLIYLLGRCVFSRTIGLLAGMAGAFYGVGIFHEGTLLTVVLIHLLNIAVLLSAYRAVGREKSFYPWLLTGVLLGLSTLSRPTVLLFFFVLAAWIWLQIYPHNKSTWKKVLTNWSALGLGMLLMMAPVTLRNMIVLQEFMLSVPHGGPNFYLGNVEQSSGYPIPFGELGLSPVTLIPDFKASAEQLSGNSLLTYSQSSRFWFAKAYQEIIRNPYHWLNLLVKKQLLFLNRYEFTTSLNYETVKEYTPFLRLPWINFGWVMPLALMGMTLNWRRWRDLFPFYGLFGIYAFANIIIIVSSEYRYSMLPAVYIFAGSAVVEIVRRTRTYKKNEVLLLFSGLLLFAVLCNMDASGQDIRNYNSATGHSNFAELYAGLGDYPRAIRELEIAKTKHSYKDKHWWWLLLKENDIMMTAGMYEQALVLLKESLDPIASQDPIILNLYANALLANGHHDEAIATRKEAVLLAPGNSTLHFYLGLTYLEVGRTKDADKAFAEAVRLDPQKKEEIEQAREAVLFKLDSSDGAPPL